MSSERPLLMLDPPVRRSRRFTGSLQAHRGRKRVVTAGLPRPGGVFGQFQYLSPPVRARASLDRQTPLTSWPPSSPVLAYWGLGRAGPSAASSFPQLPVIGPLQPD